MPVKMYCIDNDKMIVDFGDDKSEFKALLNMIWSARKMFSQMEITDDYGQATDYMESKKYKISLRELTDEEHSYIQELFNSGITKHPDMIMTIIKQGLGMSDDEEWYEHINVKVDYNASRGLEFSGCWFSVAAFILITDELYRYRDYIYRGDDRGFGVRHTQMRHFYNDKVYPLLDSMSAFFKFLHGFLNVNYSNDML